jgi:extracellular elastinolytic metalloproteinase
MKKSLHLQFLILLVLSAFTPAFGQSGDYLQKSYQHIETKYGLTPESVGELKIRRQYATAHNHVEHLQLVQVYKGIEISGSGINLAFQQNGTVSSVNHNLKMLDKFPVTEQHPKLTMGEAITRAAISLGQPSRSIPGLKKYTDKGIPLYDGDNISLQDIPVQLSYLPTKTGAYRLVYSMYIESAEKGALFLSWIDAVTGESIANDNMTLHCRFEDGYLSRGEGFCENEIHSKPVVAASLKTDGQYYALPLAVESPNHGNFDLLTGVDDPEASPLGWHDSDGITGADHTDTRGNNVHAFPDRDYNYLPDFDVDGGADLIFDFPFDPFAEPVDLQEISTTNLFVRTNMMHDFAFQYGFDEAAGNFQQHNYTNDGEGGDYIEAIAQFGASDPLNCGIQTNLGLCSNNADFATPPDGMKGRMRMFTWDQDYKNYFLNVITPSNLAGFLETGPATFGTPITNIPVTGEVVEINDVNGIPSGFSGCDTISDQPEVADRIALMDRGECPIGQKILNAQNAGAIGAIICSYGNNVTDFNLVPFGPQITIPAVMINSNDCARIRLEAGKGLIASLVVPVENGPIEHDGALDNGIISHEYAHGISNRLTGTGCLSPGALIGDALESWAMGEGWSDFFALATTVQPGDTGKTVRGIGTYVNNEPNTGRGLLFYPYSTDLSINPNEYDYVAIYGTYNDPFNVGSVWGSMLWDLYWAFSDVYGWDPDLYHGTGGNNMAIQLVMDGLKIGPCNPGFIDGRDAILEADMINNSGANQCLIWSTFARRGLGQDATQGDPDSWFDGEAGYVVPRTCTDQLLVIKTMSPEVIAGETIEVRLELANYKAFQVTNVILQDSIPIGCAYVQGSASIDPVAGSTLSWAFDAMDPDEVITVTYLVKTDPALRSTRLFYDDMEGLAEDRWDSNPAAGGSALNLWLQTGVIVHGGLAAFGVEDIGELSQQVLKNVDYLMISGNTPVYRFYHYYDTEKRYDGGILEISTETDPDKWTVLESEIFRNSYPTYLIDPVFGRSERSSYTGLSSSEKKMDATYVDLSEYVGEKVKFRYRFHTSNNTSGDGWYVDDVEITDALFYNSEACSISDQTEQYCSPAPERGTFVESQIPTATEGDQSTVVFDIMPNPADDLIRVVMSSKKSENAIVSVYNLTGLQLNHSAWNLSEGLNQKTIDISTYASGMYLLLVKTAEGIRSEKFIKE